MRIFRALLVPVILLAGFIILDPSVRAAADSYVGDFLRDSVGRLAVNCESGCATPIPQPTTTPGSIPKTNPADASGNSFTSSNPLFTNATQGTAAASSASWPFFLYGLTGTNQADVNASHQLLTLAAQGGSPWGVSCTAANCTTKIGDGTNTATVPASGADATSNATPAVAAAAFGYGYNGSTWDRLRSLNTGQLIVSPVGPNGAQQTFGGPMVDGIGVGSTGGYTVGFAFAFNGSTWDRARKDTYAAGPQWKTDGGATATPIAANAASPQVIKGSAGRLARIMVTSSAAAEIDCFDNASGASGTKIGVIASGAAVGTVATFEMPAANGITCGGGATYPGYTISYW